MNYQPLLKTAIVAARAAGKLQRQNFHKPLRVTAEMAHDVKLELDVRSQELIEKLVLRRFPDHEILGEEETAATRSSLKNQTQEPTIRWVIDPIDGTVNFFYNIPIFCVSIAAQERLPDGEWHTVVGVIYDPMRDELFSTSKGQPTRLNGRVVHASRRSKLGETICAVAFFKDKETIRRGRAAFETLLPRVRKLRLLGAAALDMAYVACGRFDAYVEFGVKLWDIAAGLLLVENAGGTTLLRPGKKKASFELVCMSNAIPKLPRLIDWDRA